MPQPAGTEATRVDDAQAPVLTTANPLGSREIASPSTILYGNALALAEQDSLGATLNGLPGVSTTTYGPFVGRPIIRGMDGDRIRILQNGVASLDASSLSFDHAVPIDPFSAERIEIVRGPAALLYGGNAVGGVVNTIDNRIPRESLDGVSGQVDSRYDTANRSRSGAAMVEGGSNGFNFHVDAWARKTGEVKIPGYAHSAVQRARDDADAAQPYGTLPNSDGQDSGGSVGASYTWASGYAGLAWSGYQADYGSVAEPSVRLRMRQDRLTGAAEVRDLDGPFKQAKFDFSYTDYQHKEIDDGETGTIFKNRGFDSRLTLTHRDIGPVKGAVGVQFSQNTFSALGDEALVPRTQTTTAALFGLEEWQALPRLKVSLGARYERVRLQPDAAGNERFAGAASREFNAGSAALGSIFQLAPNWSVAGNLSYTERAPTLYELYANGPHEATGQFLIGNADAAKEKAISADLSLRFENGPNKASFGGFYSRFHNYLAEYATGRLVDDNGTVSPDGELAEAVYRGVPATFYGLETDSTLRVFERGGHHVDVGLRGDYTHARNSDTGEPIPRIAPLRATLSLDYGYGAWFARGVMVHAWAQHRHPDDDTPTSGYTTLSLTAGYRFKIGRSNGLLYVRGDNLTNQTVRYASSVLRDIAPQPGRGVTVGLRTTF
ncbi:TonB-dependent receptor [Chitinasiproducens palmae]|nr:TonB-dependent receptor [Chitinasiproducens palmae]